MEDQILQLLKEIKEHIKNLDTKIDDIERDINSIELITSKNWMDIIQLKQASDASEDLTVKNDIR